MALADSVPGVSGGTVAFVLGFYDKFINALNILISKKENKKEEKENVKGKYKNLIFTLIGIIVVSAITYFNPQTGSGANIDITNLNFGLAIYVFLAGMIAILAMILPGISGSTLLLIFGLYIPIMEKVKAFISLDFSAMPVLIIFGLGMIAGIVTFTKLIRMCLEKFRSQTVYTILGMMLGSLYSIVMGATTLDIPKPAMTFSTFNIITFILGGVIITGLELLKRYFDKTTK
jgi:putative membrane protein